MTGVGEAASPKVSTASARLLTIPQNSNSSRFLSPASAPEKRFLSLPVHFLQNLHTLRFLLEKKEYTEL